MGKLLKISQQTLWQVSGKFVTSLSTIVVLSIISRRFGEVGTGIFTLALTYLAFFTLVIDFGVNAHLISDMGRNGFELAWRKLFGFRLLLAIFLIPVAMFGGLTWRADAEIFRNLILIGSAMAILEPAIYVSANAIFQSRLRYDLSVIGWSGAALSTLLLVFITTAAGLNLSWVMIDYSIGWIVGSLISLYFAKRFINNIWPIFDLRFVKRLIKQAWPISATLVLNVIYFRLDAFILSLLKGFAAVGVYNLPYQIFQAILVLPTFIMNAYYPLMLRSFAENKVEFKKELNLALTVMLGIGFLASLATLALSGTVLNLVTGGQGFVGSSQVLNILSLGFPAFFMSSVLMWALITLKRYKTMALIYLIGLLVNGVANLLFIPQYSYTASAYITVYSETLILILQAAILIPILRKLK